TPLLGIVRLFDRDPMRLRTGRWFRRLGRCLTRINPWRIHISGLENLRASQVYVIVSNHQSFADIPVITHLMLDTKWLAKAELFRVAGGGVDAAQGGGRPGRRVRPPQSRKGDVAVRPLPAPRLFGRLFSRRHAVGGWRSFAVQRRSVCACHSGADPDTAVGGRGLRPGSAEEVMDLRRNAGYLSAGPRGGAGRRLDDQAKRGAAR